MASNQCRRCGAPLDPATGRCPACDAQAKRRPQPVYQDPLYEDPLSPQPSGEAPVPQKNKKNTVLIVLIVAAALLAAAAAIGALGMRGMLDIPFLRGQTQTSVPATETQGTTQPETVTVPTTAVPVTQVPVTAASAPPATAASAEGAQPFKLENAMRLRSGPGTGYGYSQVIPAGAEVAIVDKQGDWVNVTYAGAAGWVYGPSAFTSWWSGGRASAEPTTNPDTVYPYNATMQSAMKLREGPGIEFGAKTVVPADSVVTVYEKQANPEGELWARIAYNGVEGWVRVKEAGV